MVCVNPNCRETLEADAVYCPFCAARQDKDDSEEPADSRTRTGTQSRAARSGDRVPTDPVVGAPASGWTSPSARPPQAARPRSDGPSAATEGGLALRASDAIWAFEEPEGPVKPGTRRALLVVDETVTHLAHTDKVISPGELYRRTESLLARLGVPVRLEEASVYWVRDPQEARPRIVASLATGKSDIKMVFGVDYLGKWASIHLHVGIEPDPVAALPPPPAADAWKPPIDGLIALGLGVLTIMMGVGLIGIGYGAWRLWTSYQQHQQRTASDRESFLARQRAEEERRAQERAAERLSRTFKVDDARLFCAAMQVVFQAVVDDIVSRGGEVVRVQGGGGGYFDEAGLSHPAPAARRSDAAQAEV
jgi:hypothetical protein